MAKPDLGKMIGPLPLGAWLAVLGGGLAIAYYTRRSGSGGDNADAPAVTDPGVGVGGSGMWADIDTPTTSAPSVQDPTTNDEWAIKAIRFLQGLGYPSIGADQAIRRYVAGETLAANEAAMVNAAIAGIGPTPQLLPPPQNGVPTTPPAPAPNTLYRYHTVLRTENFASIVIKEKISPERLWQANSNQFIRLDGSRGILSSYKLGTGYRLIIPTTSKLNNGYYKK